MNALGYVIVGTGVTAISAAATLRREGFSGPLELFGLEKEEPYERPPLSKQFLRGEVGRERIRLRSPDFFAQNNINLNLGNPLVTIDADNHVVACADGRQVKYEKVLIATGATPRRFTVPGHDLKGIYYLRTLNDCEQIRAATAQKPHVLVLGTGFIGCEVAASLRQVGCTVTLVGNTLPLEHVLGPEVGNLYATYHRSRGVEVKAGVSVAEFRGSDRVQQAVLSDQSAVPCDAVVIGIGVTPALDVVPKSIHLDNGIATDEFCRTSVERIWAAGDVAASWRPNLSARVRFEHFTNAQLQGAAAAKNMLGKATAYDPIPYFWSDQFDLNLQYFGYAPSWDTCFIRRKASEPSFVAFYMRQARIEAVCIVNQPKQFSAAKRLLGQVGIPASQLADAAVDLDQLGSRP